MVGEELLEWEELVAEGARLRAEKNAVKEAERSRELAAERGPVWADRSGWKAKRPKKGTKKNAELETPVEVRRWILARRGGASVAEASSVSGSSWSEVIRSFNRCEETRCAVDAMHRDNRRLQEELAYGVVEDVLKGKDVSAVAARTAEWKLERGEGGHYADPRTKAALGVVGASDGRAVGGIVINLIDVSKGNPLAVASGGSGEVAG